MKRIKDKITDLFGRRNEKTLDTEVNGSVPRPTPIEIPGISDADINGVPVRKEGIVLKTTPNHLLRLANRLCETGKVEINYAGTPLPHPKYNNLALEIIKVQDQIKERQIHHSPDYSDLSEQLNGVYEQLQGFNGEMPPLFNAILTKSVKYTKERIKEISIGESY